MYFYTTEKQSPFWNFLCWWHSIRICIKCGTRQKHLPLTSLTNVTDVTNIIDANPSLVADVTDIAVTDMAPAYVVVLVYY